MTTASATPHLRELLQAHDVTCLEEGPWLRLGPAGPRAQAWFVDAKTHTRHCSVRLDVVLQLWTGRELVESCGGFGTTAHEAERDAFENFTRGSLHVLLAAFVRPPDEDEQVSVEEWEIAGVRRRVVLGNIVGRGVRPSEDATNGWFQFLESAIETLPLASGTHWVRIYYAQQHSEPLMLEVLLDNEEWPELKAALAELPWPRAQDFLSQRLFLVLQGGVDVSQAVAAFVDPPNDDAGEVLQKLRSSGATPLEAEMLMAYIPLAFGQVLAGSMGARLPDAASLYGEGSRSGHPVVLSRDPLWREALRLAEQAFRGESLEREQFIELALRSSTVQVLNDALKAGSKPEDLIFASPAILLSAEAASELRSRAPGVRPWAPTPTSPSTPAPAARPWWKFW